MKGLIYIRGDNNTCVGAQFVNGGSRMRRFIGDKLPKYKQGRQHTRSQKDGDLWTECGEA